MWAQLSEASFGYKSIKRPLQLCIMGWGGGQTQSSCQQSLAPCMWFYRFVRHARCKNEGVMEACSKVPESCPGQVVGSRVSV